MTQGGIETQTNDVTCIKSHSQEAVGKQIQMQASVFDSRVCVLNHDSWSPHHKLKQKRGPGSAEEPLGGEGKLRQGTRKVILGSRAAGGSTAPWKIWLTVNQVEKASEGPGDGPRMGARERGL